MAFSLNSNRGIEPIAVSNHQSIDSEGLIANVNFLYDFGPRFEVTIKKGDLDKVKSATYFYTEEEIESIVSFKSAAIIVIENEAPSATRAYGTDPVLNTTQIELLNSFGHSTNFQIGGEFVRKNKDTGQLEDGFSRPHVTVVPEKQVEYVDGKEALIQYLINGSKDQISKLDQNKLQPGKVHFIVTENGVISDVKFSLTCGYRNVDELMIKLIINAPGNWSLAKDLNGNPVPQELVFSFGDMSC